MRLLAVSLALAVPCPALAQVVNVLPLVGAETDEGLQAEATAGGSYLTGNVPFLTFRGALLGRYHTGRNYVISSSNIDFGRGGGDPFLNRQTTHLRYQRELADELMLEAYTQATHDAVWRLQIRALAGVGARFRLVTREKIGVVTGLGYMFEHERLSRTEDVGDSGLRRYNHRLGSYATVAWRPDEDITFVQTVFFQPRFDAPADLRLFSLSSIAFKIKDKLAISANMQVLYNTWTPETIVPVDTTTTWQLTWKL